MANFGNFWQLMATHSHFWQIMATFGNWWQLMATFGSLWQLMATSGLCQLIATYGIFLSTLATLGYLWQDMAPFHSQCHRNQSPTEFLKVDWRLEFFGGGQKCQVKAPQEKGQKQLFFEFLCMIHYSTLRIRLFCAAEFVYKNVLG